MSDTDPAYVGRKACGCVIAAMVDGPSYRASNAKEIAKLIKLGYDVERLTVEEVRALPWATGPRTACEHDAARVSAQLEIGAA